jgi:hypothetical protein
MVSRRVFPEKYCFDSDRRRKQAEFSSGFNEKINVFEMGLFIRPGIEPRDLHA